MFGSLFKLISDVVLLLKRNEEHKAIFFIHIPTRIMLGVQLLAVWG